MRYLIDERNLELDTSLAVYRTALTWAAARSEYFILSLQPGVYNNPEDETRLRALGKVTTIPIARATDSENLLFQEVVKFFSILTDTLQIRVKDRPTQVVQVRGTPDDAFVRELTRKEAPEKAISGDLCLAEDVELFLGKRRLYSLYDYGRTQILDLIDEELESIHQTFTRAGLDPSYLISTPPYVEPDLRPEQE
ncbi:MAG: hypothetical protein RLP02_38065 [Coleofasciculus sp. C2-GNP5-27]